MKRENAFSNSYSTACPNLPGYSYVTSAIPRDTSRLVAVNSGEQITIDSNLVGKYSVFEIADWFLAKSEMTHKKLQKLCYYAQAWCYALKGFRLEDTDFQAWVHGPVSPALWEKFKSFGFDSIRITGNYENTISPEDEKLLDDVWDTYGDETGNALEALTHRELPWRQARKGYEPGERCTIIISPETMASYYRAIYSGY